MIPTDLPKLSICIIVKDEEANLKRCLDSFLPIIHEPWCELVILDTGSTDRTLEVARQYTDKVFERRWDPWDFSAARNHCIAQASGDLVLTVDADEDLLPASRYVLEDLVLNPEFAGYRTFFFTIRNYVSDDLDQFTPMLQPRMFRRADAPIYSHAVHNKPKNEEPHVYAMDVVFGHYGYLFRGDEDLRQKKLDRSLPLLLSEFEEDNTDLHAVTHLVKTYFLMNDNGKVKEFGERWIELMRGIDYHDGWYAYLEALVQLVYVYSVERDEENTLRVVKEAERYTGRLMAAYYLVAKMYVAMDARDKAAEYFQRCVDIASTPKKLHEHLLNSNDRQIIPEALNYLACWHFARGEYDLAGQHLQEGIRMNEANLPLRWDIWNEEDCAKMLIDSAETVEA